MNRPAITKDRFRRWGKALKANDATPLFTLGLSSKNQFVLCTTENMSDAQLEEMLIAAIGVLRNRVQSN